MSFIETRIYMQGKRRDHDDYMYELYIYESCNFH